MVWRRRSRPQLIICLGNTNDAAGELSPTARARADLTVELSKAHPRARILPTGGFGQFNRSLDPHGLHLARHLEAAGVQRSRILSPLNSSGTHDDAWMTRRIAMDEGFEELIVVTSRGHMPRAKYLFQRACAEFELSFEAAADTEDPTDHLVERYKLAREQATWIDPPLYGPGEEQRTFPAEIYTNANDEQKHYDRISYLMVAGQFVLFGFGYSNNVGWGAIPRGAALAFTAVLIGLLFLMYLRTATFANTSRDLMKAIELQWSPGFSLNARRRNFARPLPSWVDRVSMPAPMRLVLLKFTSVTNFVLTLGFTTTVTLVTVLMILAMLVSILFEPGQPFGRAANLDDPAPRAVQGAFGQSTASAPKSAAPKPAPRGARGP